MGAGTPPSLTVKSGWFIELAFIFVAFALGSYPIADHWGRVWLFAVGELFVLKWYFTHSTKGADDETKGATFCKCLFAWMIMPEFFIFFALLTFVCALMIARRAFASYSEFFCAFATHFFRK